MAFILHLFIVFGVSLSYANDFNCKEYFHFVSAKQLDHKVLIQKRSDVSFMIALAELSVRMSRGHIASLSHKLRAVEVGRPGYEESYAHLTDQIEHANKIMKKHVDRLNTYKRHFDLINLALAEKGFES